jgi:PAS domain S-box-containing protein
MRRTADADRSLSSNQLPDTFDALLEAPRHRMPGATWPPLVVIALLVLLIGGLFVAILAEDRKQQRDALHRDTESAAQQIGARIIALNEVLSTAAIEIGNRSIERARLRSIVRDLAAAKPELLRVDQVDPQGRPQWALSELNVATPARGAGAEPELVAALERAGAGTDPQYVVLTDAAGASTILLTVTPVYTAGRYTGALVARVLLRDLMRNALTPEITEKYRVSIRAADLVLTSTSASTPPPDAPTYAIALSPLPSELRLQASPYRRSSPLTQGTLAWVVIGLGAAAAIALGVLVRNLTRQARVDRALLAETSLRRAMEQSMATGLRVLDPKGMIRYVNRAFCQMTGYPEAELVGRGPPYPYWTLADRAANEVRLRQALAGEAPPGGIEVQVQRRDGSTFDARMYVSPLVDDSGRHIGWMTSMADITEPKRTRNELASAHQRFTTVLESLATSVSVVAKSDPGTPELLFANREYRECFGDTAAAHERLSRRLRGRERPDRSGEVLDETTGRWFDVRVRSIRWPAFLGDVTGRAAQLQIASDITLRKTTEEIIRQQQDKVQFTSRLMTMGEMASSLAHELNQPLTAISNYSEGLLARLRDGRVADEALVQALEKTAGQAQRAGRIIRRIREFVKRSEPRRRATPAARVIEDAVGFAEIEAAKKRITIDVDIEAGLPPLLVDPILIEQVLLNLLKNAIEAMDEAQVRRIEVRVARGAQPGMAQFVVADHGSGVPDEHLPNLFQPFFSTKSEGMGMGLNICRSIVEFHQGRLTVEPNRAAAGGTVMRFTLPLAASGDIGENRPRTMEHSTK